MTFMSVDVPERFVRRLLEVKGRESEEGRDIVPPFPFDIFPMRRLHEINS